MRSFTTGSRPAFQGVGEGGLNQYSFPAVPTRLLRSGPLSLYYPNQSGQLLIYQFSASVIISTFRETSRAIIFGLSWGGILCLTRDVTKQLCFYPLTWKNDLLSLLKILYREKSMHKDVCYIKDRNVQIDRSNFSGLLLCVY
jgi:hypothetical protein